MQWKIVENHYHKEHCTHIRYFLSLFRSPFSLYSWQLVIVVLLVLQCAPRQLIISFLLDSMLFDSNCIRSTWHFLSILHTHSYLHSLVHGMRIRIRTSLKRCPWARLTNLYVNIHLHLSHWNMHSIFFFCGKLLSTLDLLLTVPISTLYVFAFFFLRCCCASQLVCKRSFASHCN